ncbi:MAG TPA: hypothetical protein VHN36_19550 [Ilumatobacteraceae bacterium]|jgi:hypothetical protein|nr:hypothetical protein [Ilumatobacteraceae bacterium]
MSVRKHDEQRVPWKTHRLRAFIWATGIVLVVVLIFHNYIFGS